MNRYKKLGILSVLIGLIIVGLVYTYYVISPSGKKGVVPSESLKTAIDLEVKGLSFISPWPTFQGDAHHTGRSYYKGPPKPTVKWIKDMNTFIIEASPVINIDGIIIIGAFDSKVYALDKYGKILWSFPTMGPVRATAAIGGDGTIYVVCRKGFLYALRDGKAKWITKVSDEHIDSSPTIGKDGSIYFGGLDGTLYAHKPDGSLKWRRQDLGAISATAPAVTDGSIYIGSYGGYVYSIDPASGKIKWRFKAKGAVRSSPVITSEGSIIEASRDGTLFMLSPKGDLIWEFKTGKDIRATPALSYKGDIYVGSWDGFFYCISNKGKLNWKFNVGYPIEASATVDAEGVVYVATLAAKLFAFYPDGKVKWTIGTATFVHGSPVLDNNGTIYLSAGGRLIAYGSPLPKIEIDLLKDKDGSGIKVLARVDTEEKVELRAWLDITGKTLSKKILLYSKLIDSSLKTEIYNHAFSREDLESNYAVWIKIIDPITAEEIESKAVYF